VWRPGSPARRLAYKGPRPPARAWGGIANFSHRVQQKMRLKIVIKKTLLCVCWACVLLKRSRSFGWWMIKIVTESAHTSRCTHGHKLIISKNWVSTQTPGGKPKANAFSSSPFFSTEITKSLLTRFTKISVDRKKVCVEKIANALKKRTRHSDRNSWHMHDPLKTMKTWKMRYKKKKCTRSPALLLHTPTLAC